MVQGKATLRFFKTVTVTYIAIRSKRTASQQLLQDSRTPCVFLAVFVLSTARAH